MNRANAWTTYEEADLKALEELCKEYKEFLSNGKTERECVAQSIELAKKAGYQDLEELIKNQTPLKAGDKVYRTWMEKTIVLFQIGEDAIEDGLNILGAHIDSPRLDLKQNPLYEDTEMALLDTHYYGGVKKYQWVTLPMALHGVVVKKDGTKVNICIGEKDEDPVVGITDLLIHLSGKQMQKKAAEVIGRNLSGSVLIKGGHLTETADDLLYHGGEFMWYRGERVNNPNTHGTGCTLSSAIASNLALGYDMKTSVQNAKNYITGALKDGLDLGEGSGPLNHCFNL